MLFGGIMTASLLTALIACLGSGIGLHWLWVAPLSFVGSFLSLTILAALVLWSLLFAWIWKRSGSMTAPTTGR